jgi:hypothetical protein
MSSFTEHQAFHIWRAGRTQKITLAELVDAGVIDDPMDALKAVFYSPGHEFERWLIVSGFQQFLDSLSDYRDEPDEWDTCQCTEPSNREKGTQVLQMLFDWMKKNEKTLKH